LFIYRLSLPSTLLLFLYCVSIPTMSNTEKNCCHLLLVSFIQNEFFVTFHESFSFLSSAFICHGKILVFFSPCYCLYCLLRTTFNSFYSLSIISSFAVLVFITFFFVCLKCLFLWIWKGRVRVKKKLKRLNLSHMAIIIKKVWKGFKLSYMNDLIPRVSYQWVNCVNKSWKLYCM